MFLILVKADLLFFSNFISYFTPYFTKPILPKQYSSLNRLYFINVLLNSLEYFLYPCSFFFVEFECHKKVKTCHSQKSDNNEIVQPYNLGVAQHKNDHAHVNSAPYRRINQKQKILADYFVLSFLQDYECCEYNPENTSNGNSYRQRRLPSTMDEFEKRREDEQAGASVLAD